MRCGIRLIYGDCIEIMKQLPRGSVDMVLCDLPYSVTECEWDIRVPFSDLWDSYNFLVRKDGAIVLHSAQPFTTALIASASNFFRYSWIWNKKFSGNFVQAKRMPLRIHEDILVFSTGGKSPRYFPQMIDREEPIKQGGTNEYKAIPIRGPRHQLLKNKIYYKKFPTTILDFNRRGARPSLHPTQKPLALEEYLIKTYTKEGETVLDNCMGSGTTGLACLNLGRKFIGIENSGKYYEIAQRRIFPEWEQRRFCREPLFPRDFK